MRLGDLLLRAGAVSPDQLGKALQLQTLQGGRVGDHLVATHAITQRDLNAFLNRVPVEPTSIAATNIDVNELLSLLMKLIDNRRLEFVRQFVNALKLPQSIVLELVRIAVERKLLFTLGMRNAEGASAMAYAATEEGRRWTIDALQQSRYAGPAPVTLKEFSDQVNLQKLTNELITVDRIRNAMADLKFDDALFEQSGPALNSGRPILLYGPPGNGKTSVASRLASVFTDVIYIPYSVIVDGQIITLYDASIHHSAVPPAAEREEAPSLLRREEFDGRWIPCKRPFVIAGGELTLEMLELRYDEASHTYEAPLHMKALGGCFVIDDFGRQLVSPTKLLNRWIVPLENRFDFLKLHTGKSFSIPFEEIVIFSTNLEPEDLMDPAFLRRLPYKIEIGAPSLAIFQQIFALECERHGFEGTDEMLDMMVERITVEKELSLAAFQPKFVLDQVVATCRFLGLPLTFEPRFIQYAVDNLRVKRHQAPKGLPRPA